MRQGTNRRPRPRGNPNKQRSGGGRNSYDSNGPAGKVRGTAQQVLDKYLALGHDTTISGDRIAAESYFQYAEHYYRIVEDDAANVAAKQENQNTHQDRRPRHNPESQPEVIVDVPVVEASAPQPSIESPAEIVAKATEADAEPEADDAPAVDVEETPKAPRRRRSRAKAETPAPESADA